MRVLIGCESSGMVRRAFAALGHDVWSCDLLPAQDKTNRHITGDVRDHLNDGWDLLAVIHPPCTRLCLSGIRWLHNAPGKIDADHYSDAERAAYAGMTEQQRLAFMWQKLEDGAALFSDCWNANIPRIAIENPKMHRHAKERIRNYQPAAQTLQPHQFGDAEFKGVGLYLKNLAPLVATNPLVTPKVGTPEHKQWSRVHMASPGKNRWQERSKFFPGIAAAMAMQWGGLVDEESALAA